MYKDIQNYIEKQDTCQREKSENIAQPSLFHPLYILEQKWEEISMDFIEDLAFSEGKDKTSIVVH
jgi:hypothetical protein